MEGRANMTVAHCIQKMPVAFPCGPVDERRPVSDSSRVISVLAARILGRLRLGMADEPDQTSLTRGLGQLRTLPCPPTAQAERLPALMP